MRKILLPMLMAGVVSFAGCDDFLSEYSQDKIVAKKVQDLDELLLGDGYLQSSAIASGPSITNPAGFFNIIDDDSNKSQKNAPPALRRRPRHWRTGTGGTAEV